MKLKLQTDYGLRVLMFLAYTEDQAPVDAIAGAFSISRDHLVKVIQELSRLGYVHTRRGRSGGVRLALDPAAIDVAEVIAGFEGRSGVLECIATPEVCILEPGCLLKKKLIAAENAFYAALAGTSLADLCKTRGRKGGLKNLPLA